jgi:hypothetical protein
VLQYDKFSLKALVHPLSYHGSLQCSVHRRRQKEDPTVERGITRKVMLYAFVASKDLEKDLDATNEVTGGAGTPSVKIAGWLANSPGRLTLVCGHSPPPPR